jgi:deoxyribose-phosphate aldolase
VLVAAAVGFPLGASGAAVKQFEAAECLKLGADELDVVIDLGALKSGTGAAVEAELASLVQLAHGAGAKLKAILELPRLTAEEKARAAGCALAAGADFLKTSTGLSGAEATPADVALLHQLAAGRAAVKASGGIRTRAQAEALVAAGATRLGTSHALDLVR